VALNVGIDGERQKTETCRKPEVSCEKRSGACEHACTWRGQAEKRLHLVITVESPEDPLLTRR